MKTLPVTLLSASCLLVVATGAFAADEMKEAEPMMKKDAMTLQDCKEHMAMAKKDGMKRDDATMKKDAACAEMTKNDAMKGDAMKKDGAMMKKDDAMMKKEEPMKK